MKNRKIRKSPTAVHHPPTYHTENKSITSSANKQKKRNNKAKKEGQKSTEKTHAQRKTITKQRGWWLHSQEGTLAAHAATALTSASVRLLFFSSTDMHMSVRALFAPATVSTELPTGNAQTVRNDQRNKKTCTALVVILERLS
jgi:hypothetical protein